MRWRRAAVVVVVVVVVARCRVSASVWRGFSPRGGGVSVNTDTLSWFWGSTMWYV
jgi:hypothetical protein